MILNLYYLTYLAVAEAVLKQCAVENPRVTAHGDPYYSVVYNYEFIEDFDYAKETCTE